MSKLMTIWFKIWLCVISFLAILVIHIIEEGTLPGGFFYMYNTVFNPDNALYDRYPINRFSEMIENFFGVIACTICFWFFSNTLTVILWFVVCLVEIPGHLVTGIKIKHILESKGKTKRTIYNPGLVSDMLGFLPVAIVMFYNLIRTEISWYQWIEGVILGIVMMLICIQIPDKIFMNKNTRNVYTEGYGYFDKFDIQPDKRSVHK
ncbi:HXXEE domain-containing protein [Lactiplantibacillus mudanjiangensis]|uniref:HXXEE domain-containing protein n=1 Tax=Lactiplantibacillus mudanjiangensis TaxID=1296538 RepID=A0A660DTI1_9LACO|nr:HXXEE domain-containing protein [Lactiplantibacillus mudanjiangensis]VDG22718.1 hypothetical protein [Lactobacillus brevis] [Lactiplantibacillus mudanjiangensis]VDG26744.1 hypothetical protein [Lactobacillus brevis] [Lactiplantibacillus mudanjiangensis]